jgi:uncharacterized protein
MRHMAAEPKEFLTTPATVTTPGPVQPGERIQTLDVLRGFALLGILLVNIHLFAHPVQYALLPQVHSGPIDRAADWFVRFAAEGKFYSLFSFLFGLGFTIQMIRAEAKGARFVPVYLRRAGVLLLFGLLHGLLLWVGDILFYYAILGLLLLFFRRMKLKWVGTWIVILILLPPLFVMLGWIGIEMGRQNPQVAAQIEAQFAGQSAAVEAQVAEAYRVYRSGDYAEITLQRGQDLLYMWTVSLFLAPSILAMFLIGLLFGRQEYIRNAAQHKRLFRRLLIWGGAIGLLANGIYATFVLDAIRDQPDLPLVIATFGQAIGAPLLALAYMSAITLAMQHPTWQSRLQLLAPVGRMALTNYLLQTLICTTLFYGYGFGLFGQIDTATGVVLAVVIFLLQIPLSHWWMARFRFGPAEWLWRTLTYGRRQPMRLQHA